MIYCFYKNSNSVKNKGRMKFTKCINQIMGMQRFKSDRIPIESIHGMKCIGLKVFLERSRDHKDLILLYLIQPLIFV